MTAYGGGIDGNAVHKVDADGNEVWQFTGHTDNVRDVAVDADGYVYSVSEDETVRKIDPDGNEVWVFTGHTSFLFTVFVDGDGYVYSGGGDSTARKIDPDGNEVWVFTGGGWVGRLVVDFDGNVYVASGDLLHKLDSDGNEIWQVDFGEGVDWVAVGCDYVYACPGLDVYKLTPDDGAEVWATPATPGAETRGMAVDSDGIIYRGDSGGYVRKLDSDGNQVWVTDVASASNTSYDLAMDRDGNTYFAFGDADQGEIAKLDSAGSVMWRFIVGQALYGVAALPGAFLSSAYCAPWAPPEREIGGRPRSRRVRFS